MRSILVFCLLFLSSAAFCQISVSGRVVSTENNSPIANVSVYINNTSIGTTTDANGEFSIKVGYIGRVDLVISHTAFQKKVMSITPGPIPAVLSVSLEPKTHTLDEVIITDDPLRGWRKWHTLFKDYFIGKSAFAKKCTIKNPEVLVFHYNKDANELKVTSRSTLIVQNKALGYVYKIDLNLFRYSFTTLELKSDVTVFFENIKPANVQEKKLFAENRAVAFRGSKMDFIRTLYKKEYNRKGFAVVAMHSRPNTEKQRINRMISEAIAQAYRENRNINSVTLASIGYGDRDTVAFYEQKLAEPDYVIIDTSSIVLNDSVRIGSDHKGLLRLKDTLLIQYSDNTGPESMAVHLPSKGDQFTLENIRADRHKNSSHSLQYTLMALRDVNEITIYPDGGYEGDLFTKGYMDDVKVAGLLPWDYEDTQPVIVSSAMENASMALSTATDTNGQAVKSILDKLKEFLTGHPSEKAYLQMDRPYYAAGDTIYFKAYVTAGERHRLSPMSRVLHVDLINAQNHIDRSIKLQLNNGIAWGDFALPDSIQNGGYRIRAYTRLMENEAIPSYFERRTPVIIVKNLRVPENSQNPNTGKRNDRINLQFFPEGGKLIMGVKSKIAFKAIGTNGLGVDIKGIITDNGGNKVCDIASRHLGMGYFYLEPAANKIYQAKLTFGKDTVVSFDLPKAMESGLVLSVNNNLAGKAVATVSANKAFYLANRNKEFSIIVYSAGEAMPFVFRLNETSVTANIDTRSLHSGIATATLFSSDGEPLAERLFFVKNNDLLDLKINSSKTTYKKREKVKIDMHAQSEGLPVNGHFSISVTDDSEVPEDVNSEHTILTDLLLTSDLKGYVEQPNYYFASASGEIADNLDILMLTQGYRRFEWESLLGGSSRQARAFQPETSLVVAGTLTTPAGQPVPNGKVIFMDGKNGILKDTITNAAGNFKFSDLNIIDTSMVLVSARRGNDNNNVKLTIKDDEPPPIIATDTNFEHSSITQQAVMPAQQRYQLLQGGKRLLSSRTINLKTVNISAHADPMAVKVQHSANLNGAGHADYVLMGDQLANCTDLPCLFGKLPGTISKNGKLYLIRTGERIGENKGYPPPPIEFFLDGMPLMHNQNYVFDMISVNDIYSIELLKSGGLLALYGSSAAGGAILITTKRGSEIANSPNAASPGLVKFQLNGFYKSRHFYSPVYDHPQNTQRKDLRPTIYWNPELTTDKDGNLSFEYYNSDGHGTCSVIVEGIDDRGNIGRQMYRYKIE